MRTRTYTVTAELLFDGEYARDSEWTITIADRPLDSHQAEAITRILNPNFTVGAIVVSEPTFGGQFERTLDQALNEGDGTYKP